MWRLMRDNVSPIRITGIVTGLIPVVIVPITQRHDDGACNERFWNRHALISALGHRRGWRVALALDESILVQDPRNGTVWRIERLRAWREAVSVSALYAIRHATVTCIEAVSVAEAEGVASEPVLRLNLGGAQYDDRRQQKIQMPNSHDSLLKTETSKNFFSYKVANRACMLLCYAKNVKSNLPFDFPRQARDKSLRVSPILGLQPPAKAVCAVSCSRP